jgi:predicted permease
VRKRPGLTAAVTATLAIGIAVTTAALSVAHAVLLRPLPYADPSGLVHLGEIDRNDVGTPRGTAGGNLSWLDFQDYRAGQRTFTALAGYSGGSRTLTGFGPPDRLPTAEATAEFFPMLGVQPETGRVFIADDAEPGAPSVALLSHGTWRRRFGGDPGIVGRAIELNGQPVTVVGVLPADFQFPLRGSAELWLPIRPSAAQAERRYYHWLNVIGRLRPGTTIDQARTDLDGIAAGFAAIDPRFHGATAVSVERLDAFVVGDIRQTLLVLLGAAVCVLLIACTNVAGLLVARATTRAREMEVRGALGATGGRLVSQMLIESGVLAMPGVLAGLGAGLALVQIFVSSMPVAQRVSLPHLENLTLHPAVVAAVLMASLLAAGLFGLAPSWRLLHTRNQSALRGVVGSDRRGARLQTSLVVAQIGLTAVLLTGAGLMGRSVMHLLAVSPGFTPEGLFTARVTLGGPRYRDADIVRASHRELLDLFSTLPGVTGASTINQLALTGSGNSGTFIVRSQPGVPERETRIRTAAANYFDVMGVPLLAGRGFAATDGPAAPLVLLVNETFAKTFFDGNPVGERIAFPFFDGRPWWEIVGVVGDEQVRQLDAEMLPVAYFAYAQTPDSGFSLVLRTRGEPAALEAPVRAALGEFDPALPLFSIGSMADILQDSDAVFRRQTVLALVAVFGGAALVLALVGLYGLVSQTLAERTREIGVRVTLGARPGHVAASIMRRGLIPAIAGIVLGVAASLVAAQAIDALLFGTSPTDPATLATVVAALAATAVLACALPAARALRIDPVEALRQE